MKAASNVERVDLLAMSNNLRQIALADFSEPLEGEPYAVWLEMRREDWPLLNTIKWKESWSDDLEPIYERVIGNITGLQLMHLLSLQDIVQTAAMRNGR